MDDEARPSPDDNNSSYPSHRRETRRDAPTRKAPVAKMMSTTPTVALLWWLLPMMMTMTVTAQQAIESYHPRATYESPRYGPGQSNETEIKIVMPPPPPPTDDDDEYSGPPFPAFVWLMGTYDRFEATVYDPILNYMASKGYVAAMPDYPNEDFCLDACGDYPCVYSLGDEYGIDAGPIGELSQPEKVRSLVKALDSICALADADCALGVAVAGFSQGAYNAVMLSTMDDRVTAISPWSYGIIHRPSPAWTGCYEAEEVDAHIGRDKRRMLIGANDGLNSKDADYDMMGPRIFSGYYSCLTGVEAPVNCIQPDGSGYYVIGESEYADSDPEITKAGHTFFAYNDSTEQGLLTTFVNGTMEWNMRPTLDWLATAAAVAVPDIDGGTATASTGAGLVNGSSSWADTSDPETGNNEATTAAVPDIDDETAASTGTGFVNGSSWADTPDPETGNDEATTAAVQDIDDETAASAGSGYVNGSSWTNTSGPEMGDSEAGTSGLRGLPFSGLFGGYSLIAFVISALEFV